MNHRIEIHYCPGCRWLLRAAWMAQELLTTFEHELAEVALKPDRKGGVFIVRLNDHVIWDRKQHGGFPELKILKQKVRDRIAPDKSLGHSEGKPGDKE